MELTYYGGSGFEGLPIQGNYQVKWADTLDGVEREYEFTDLLTARKFYNTLNVEKAFWDLDCGELIDAYYLYDESVSSDLPF